MEANSEHPQKNINCVLYALHMAGKMQISTPIATVIKHIYGELHLRALADTGGRNFGV